MAEVGLTTTAWHSNQQDNFVTIAGEGGLEGLEQTDGSHFSRFIPSLNAGSIAFLAGNQYLAMRNDPS